MFQQLYPGIKWGMIAVIMPVKELEKKTGNLYYNMLPPLGVNRNIGKGWRMLPARYQGLGLPNYTLECLILKVNFLQKPWGNKLLPGGILKQECEVFK